MTPPPHASQPQRVEINDPMDCDIHIGAAPVTPAQGEGRLCPQCGHATWMRTHACMWCGFDRWATLTKLGIAAALAAIIGLLVRIYPL